MRGYVTARVLNVRSGPSTTHKVFYSLRRGTIVTIVDRHGEWLEIRNRYGGDPAEWVHGDWVSIVDPEPASGFLRDHPELQSVDLAPTGRREGRGPIVSTWNRLGGLLSAAAGTMHLEPAVALAVLLVESGGRGFDAEGRLLIRFENHVFWDRWGVDHKPGFRTWFRFSPQKRWQGHKVCLNSGEWLAVHPKLERYAFAVAGNLDSRAAHLSISMGGAQIMGFNHHLIGYGSPEAMYDRFAADERWQVLGFFDFIKGPGSTSPMLEALRRGKSQDFAALYNGPGQAARYGSLIDERLAAVRKVLG